MTRPDFGLRPQGAIEVPARLDKARDSGSSAAGSHGPNDVASYIKSPAINKNGA